ncbi:hypothetical protein GLW08_16190 [Pontibacillus yanchengensis]|uniref:Uncharacterized protein n=2 Tax=Pontibacillus yanchengensis TaxID=462910 RepID=A0ACC7VJK4_9BACI|nr:hypothetical protein [Pontibacillus yanchengensis]MYL35265.1 hypothetical protein [Pontibacillus yanchengensis]MYL54875.1 hypothetical protein [Pontibacillus yanchengensis]
MDNNLSKQITEAVNRRFAKRRKIDIIKLLDHKKNRWIKISKVELVTNYKVRCKFEVSKDLKTMIQEDFFAEYDSSIENVPKSILVIPALSNISTIAWVLKANVYLDELDSNFYNSLQTIKRSFQKLYPNIDFIGEIYPKYLKDNKGYSRKNSALLFSGGVDSTVTYINHRRENPLLITGWGPDMNLTKHKEWKEVQNFMIRFGKKNQLQNCFVKTNMSEFFRRLPLTKIINRKSSKMLYWYPHIQHGLALLGLCAPISFSKGLEKIYIASSNSSEFPIPYGSHPTIENNTHWGETKCIYDGFDYERQDKIRLIKDYIFTKDKDLQIRVCFISPGGNNCSRCTKCKDTIIGLVLEGINPNNHGFTVNEQTFQSTIDSFENGRRKFGDIAYFYRYFSIQKRAQTQINAIDPKYKFFYEWLINTNLKSFLTFQASKEMSKYSL